MVSMSHMYSMGLENAPEYLFVVRSFSSGKCFAIRSVGHVAYQRSNALC